jgi:hypothetical protein
METFVKASSELILARNDSGSDDEELGVKHSLDHIYELSEWLQLGIAGATPTTKS